MEGIPMGYHWPTDTVFTQRLLTVEQPVCDGCQRRLHVCDHRLHRIHTLQGPVEIVCKLAHCPDPDDPAAHRTLTPPAEAPLSLPHRAIAWALFFGLFTRRFGIHWSLPPVRLDMRDN